MSLSLPRIYANRYEVIEPIGDGAFSRTFLATDTLLDRPVAVKILRREHADDVESATRFDREARAAAQVSHPNVVAVYDFGREGDLPFIVMEYVDGPSLREYVRDEGSLTVEEALSFARQILDGLAAIHDVGIVHRDIKPQNILLDRNLKAKLTDFGVAFLGTDASLTQTGMTVGTAAYMAPEQASGDGVGPQSDLYSVGVVLYELLTGQLPFPGDNPVQVMYRHVSEMPPRPRTLNSAIPMAVEGVILRALSKIPSDRYGNARTMRDALLGAPHSTAGVPPAATGAHESTERFSLPTRQGQPVAAGPPAPPRRGGRRTVARRRRPWPVLWVLAVLVMVGATAGLAFAGGVFDDGDNSNNEQPNPGVVVTDEPGSTATEALPTATDEPTQAPEPTGTPPPAPTATATVAVTETPVPPSPTATLEPTPEPTAEPTQAPTQSPTPAATETQQPAGSPSGAFNAPFPAASVPAAWAESEVAEFGRDAFVTGGAYQRPDGVLYGEPAAHLYSQATNNSATSVTFNVAEAPSTLVGIVITGMDDEFDSHVPIRLSLNGNAVWEGPSPFGNEQWTTVGWAVGDLSWLVAGQNTLTVQVLAAEGEFGLPPWILLTEARVYWS